MKKIYILTLLLCFISFGNSFAQTLKGHIYDAKTNEPLVGAAVTYKLQGNQGVVSDINGAYEIKLPEGGVDLVFSYVGYEDVLMPIVIDRREVVTKDVYMRESTKLLEEVVVSAGRFEQKLSNVTVSMDVVKAGDIARQAPTDISSTLRTLPGVDIVDKQPSIRGGSGWTYGVGARSQILVDGMSTLNPENRRNQLEHRAFGECRAGGSYQRSFLRTVRFVGSERYYQYPYRTSGIDSENTFQRIRRYLW